MHLAKDERSKLNNKLTPCIFLGYSKDEFGYRQWDLLDKKVVRNRDIVFLEDNMIEDWNQHKLELSPQSTPSTMDLRLVNSTLSANRRLLIDTAKSEWVNLEQLTFTYKSELANP